MLSPAFADVRPASAMGVDIALESRESEACADTREWLDGSDRPCRARR